MRLFARDEAGENQHGPFYTGLPDGDSLFGASDAEPIGAEFFERFGDLRPTVAVAIALHDAQHFSRRRALFARWIHICTNRVQVVLQRAERDFRPDWPAFEINFVIAFGRH